MQIKVRANHLVYLLIAFSIIFCVICASLVLVRARSSQIAIQRIGETLDIDPTWTSFYNYLDTHIKPGMPRDEVLQELNKIAPYTINPYGNCERVAFKAGILNITSINVIFCYKNDEAQSLIRHALQD